MDNTVYATLEQGTTHWLARILEPNKPPVYFVPSGIYHGIAMSLKSVLCKAVNDAYGAERVVFVSVEKFNKLVAEAEGRVLTLPEDWPSLQFQPGQSVYVVASHGHIYDEITGIRREERYEDGAPDVYVLEYRVFGAWYTADKLSVDPPAEQMVTTGALVNEDDDLFLFGDESLP